MSFQTTLLSAARLEIGVEEIDGTNCGPRVNEYKAATNLDPQAEWPWCAAFVCWCVQKALAAAGIHETRGFLRPETASAFGLISWSLRQDHTTQTIKNPDPGAIRVGDIIVYKFSHCGIAASDSLPNGDFHCVEGNTNGGGSREGGIVLEKLRRADQVQAIIRFRL